MSQHLASYLASLSDLERVVGRIALMRATIHDYRGLNDSLAVVPAIKNILFSQAISPLLKAIEEKMFDVTPLAHMLSGSLETDGERIIKKGCDLGLDELRDVLDHRAQAIATFEAHEREKTGITSLKVESNNITGYYIEITNPNLDKVPETYQELQKLVNRKRFTTPELHDLERAITKAQNELEATENAVFDRIKNAVFEYVSSLRVIAYSLAYLDALYGLSVAAAQNHYVLPVFTEQSSIMITDGRHPIVEQSSSVRFIPNDTKLDETQKTWIITGPNMGGKSTYLRQVALISIMAQCGSLVPAREATLPILDRVFTRIGSGDNLAEGKSTFLVEMEETAAICLQATSNSLVILDEVGRGTSTYDGISLAQAIVEHITQEIKPLCLFATHFHELTVLPSLIPGIANYHMMGKKQNNTMIFLYKMIPGVAGASFGLDVARLADMPESIIRRAAEIHEKLISN
jgi:DNA mismatch repair protein MutS